MLAHQELADRIERVEFDLKEANAALEALGLFTTDLEQRVNQEESDRQRAVTSLEDRVGRIEAGY